MIISKIEVKGAGKKTATIKLEKGLNVIAGATNTGKSYICECFQFIFGAEDAPKSIDEAKGYTSLEVSFIENDGTSFTLKRELSNGSDITLEIGELTKVLKPNLQGGKKKENISNFFLEKLGLQNSTLAKGLKNLTHTSLSLRILEKIFLVDEQRIIATYSPLGTGSRIETTQEVSLLKTLLTGTDDSEILNSKERKYSKSSLKQKISHLNEFMEDFVPRGAPQSITIDELKDTSEKLSNAISDEQKQLENHVSLNKELIKQKNSLQAKNSELHSNLNEENTVLERFKLLQKKYASDLERLEANSEVISYLAKHEASQCPTCGNPISDAESIDDQLIRQCNLAEIHKTKCKVSDLDSTIHSIEKRKSSLKHELMETDAELSKVLDQLNGEIIEQIRQHNEKVKLLNDEKIKTDATLANKETRSKIATQIVSLKTDHDEILDKYEIPDFSTELEGLNDEISKILTRWDYPEGNAVKFDIKTRDITIGDKPRSHFGKGYRAISFASYLIGLLNLLSKQGRHPGFLIMDSPLTTYKQGDEKVIQDESEQENIVKNLIYAFYRDLCDYYNDKQIIIMDNQEPASDLITKMNHIHFSGNQDVGRAGFFPIS